MNNSNKANWQQKTLKAKQLFKVFLLWILPAKCLYCQALLRAEDEADLCLGCVRGLLSERLQGRSLCPKCSHPEEENVCPHCSSSEVDYRFEAGTAAFPNAGVAQRFMYDYKFKRKRRFASILGRLLLEHYGPFLASWEVVVPVTLNRRSLWRREFCPVLEVVRVLRKGTKVPIVCAVRRRFGFASTAQHKKGKREREEVSAQLVFRKRAAKRLSGKRVLLIDDIFTTGSTLNAYAEHILANVNDVRGLEVFVFLRTLVSPKKPKNP